MHEKTVIKSMHMTDIIEIDLHTYNKNHTYNTTNKKPF